MLEECQMFYPLIQQIHYKMIKDHSAEQERYLLSNLLQDEEHPTTQARKHDQSKSQLFALSAPPIFFGFDQKLQQDFGFDLDGKHDPEVGSIWVTKSNSKRGSAYFQDEELPPAVSLRKLSLQTQSFMDSNTQNYSPNQIFNNFCPGFSAEADLIANIEHVCRLAKDQYGSRTVQNVLESCSQETKEAIFSFIFEEGRSLTKDRFGNYVIQKLFEIGSQGQKIKLLGMVKQYLIELAENCYGCRVVQKAIEYTYNQPEEQQQLMNLIQPYCLQLIQNQNGNHVIQKCCETMVTIKIQAIANILVSNLSRLAFHAYGCRVIQKYLENARGQEAEQKIIRELLSSVKELSQCQYGNYVMQHIVCYCPQFRQQILQIFYQNFLDLSTNKYASNVIEKALRKAPLAFRDRLLQHILDNFSYITLSKHQYGNYVIQSLVQIVSKEKKVVIKAKIRENASEISKSQYGRHVLLQLEKIR